MQTARTLMGVEFRFSGSLSTGLVIHKNVNIRIPHDAIKIIQAEIEEKSPVLMGACRDNPPVKSIGNALMNNGYSPQFSSYVVPLLISDGFCIANEQRPFVVTKLAKN
jgi:hypothetical protein